MIVLGIDTGGSACSVALTCDAGLLARDVLPMRHGHARHLAPLIDRLLSQSEIRPANLDLIGVTVGPGGFTGLRVGLAAAGGLALATGARIVGVSSFEAVAASCRPLTGEEKRAVVIDSRRAEPYLQIFDAGGTVGSADWRRVAALAEDLSAQGVTLLAGDGAPAVAAMSGLRQAALEATGPIDPVAVCRLALVGAARGRSDPPTPVYLRPPDAKLPGGVTPPPWP